jgi:hypothetical protein
VEEDYPSLIKLSTKEKGDPLGIALKNEVIK